MNDALPQRILDLLVPIPHCGCWVFVGDRLSRNGYGRVWWDGKERPVHKVVWEILCGPVQRGLVLDHLCRVRLCAYPGHLEPVTVKVNTERGLAVLYASLNAMRPASPRPAGRLFA